MDSELTKRVNKRPCLLAWPFISERWESIDFYYIPCTVSGCEYRMVKKSFS